MKYEWQRNNELAMMLNGTVRTVKYFEADANYHFSVSLTNRLTNSYGSTGGLADWLKNIGDNMGGLVPIVEALGLEFKKKTVANMGHSKYKFNHTEKFGQQREFLYFKPEEHISVGLTQFGSLVLMSPAIKDLSEGDRVRYVRDILDIAVTYIEDKWQEYQRKKKELIQCVESEWSERARYRSDSASEPTPVQRYIMKGA